MRKQILLVGFLIAIATQSLAQGVTVQNSNPTSSIANRGSYIADSIFRLGTRDTVKPIWWNPAWSFNGAFQLGLDGKPYYYSGGKWNGFAGGSGGSGTVTAIAQGYGIAVSPSNPITTSGSITVDTTLIASKSFTANEYAPISTTVRLTGVQTMSSKTIAASIIQAPTFSMVTNGGSLTDSLLVMNPSSGLVYLMNPSRVGGGADSSVFATNYRVDTAKTNLRTSIATKLNISDTASMLANYYDVRDTGRSNGNVVTGGTLSKVTDSLGALIGGGGVSAASVAEINTGTDNTKFASPLGLEGSKYVEQDGVKNYAVTTGTSTAYVLATTPSFTPTTGTILYVKFHVANTGAATINVNGSGAVALQKDLSTALVANDIPINIEYTIRRTTTGWLIEDIGFAGVNLSARLLGALSDETGTGVAVFGTTPTFTTSVLGGATFSAFNTTTTNLSLGGAATTMTIGGTPTTALTHTYSGNATASGQTKTLNFGTGGASGSTTAITIGSSTSGATNNIRLNTTPASDATGDIWYRNASGFMTRLGIGTTGQVLTVAAGLPSWATAGAGSGWGLTGNAIGSGDFIGGTSATTNPLILKWNGLNSGYINGANISYGTGAYSGTSNGTFMGYNAGRDNAQVQNTAIGYEALKGNTVGANNVVAGHQALSSGTNVNGWVVAGFQAAPSATGNSGIAIGSDAGFSITTGSKNLVVAYQGTVPSATGSNQLNIGNVLWGSGCSATGTTAAGSLSVGVTSPDVSAILDLTSTTQGFLPPRMTGTQADAIASKAEGLIVYVTTATGSFSSKGWYGWNGTIWEKFNP